MLWSLSVSASIIEWKDADVTKGAVWYGYFSMNSPLYAYWHYEVTGGFSAQYVLNPITIRGFSEFSLQKWYDSDIDASHITSVTLTYSESGSSGILYEVRDISDSGYKDGVITTDQFDSQGTLIAQQSSQPSTPVTIDVTSIVLNDINSGNDASGFMLKLVNEGPDFTMLSFSTPTLTIETDLQDAPAVPEPATMLLVFISALCAFRKTHK